MANDRNTMIKEIQKFFVDEFHDQLERLSQMAILTLFGILHGRIINKKDKVDLNKYRANRSE